MTFPAQSTAARANLVRDDRGGEMTQVIHVAWYNKNTNVPAARTFAPAVAGMMIRCFRAHAACQQPSAGIGSQVTSSFFPPSKPYNKIALVCCDFFYKLSQRRIFYCIQSLTPESVGDAIGQLYQIACMRWAATRFEGCVRIYRAMKAIQSSFKFLLCFAPVDFTVVPKSFQLITRKKSAQQFLGARCVIEKRRKIFVRRFRLFQDEYSDNQTGISGRAQKCESLGIAHITRMKFHVARLSDLLTNNRAMLAPVFRVLHRSNGENQQIIPIRLARPISACVQFFLLNK